jgi:predicted dehydrogenase
MTKVAVIGAGSWGINHVKTFYNLGSLAAIIEPNEVLQRKLKMDYKNIPIYSNMDHVLKDKSIKGVVIATPVKTHFILAKKAIEAGKDVFIEKPITLSSVDGEKLVELAERSKSILMVGHLLLYQPAIQFIKNYINSGEIGDIKGIHQQRTKLGKVKSFENVLWSFAVHDIAVLLYLLDKYPMVISSKSQFIIQEDIADDVYLHLGFSNNLSANLHISWYYPEDVRKMVIVGSEGMLVYNEHDQSVTLHRKKVGDDLQSIDNGKKLLFIGDSNPLQLECEHFLTCIAERKKPLSDGKNGVDVIRLLEKTQKEIRQEKSRFRLLGN